jgi:hypothetical protein
MNANTTQRNPERGIIRHREQSTFILSDRGFRSRTAANYKTWAARTMKKTMTLEVIDLGPFEPEDVEVRPAIVSCSMRISDPTGARHV